MLVYVINFLIYYVIYSYFLTISINFLHPITAVIALIIYLCSLIFSIISTRYIPFKQFTLSREKPRLSFIAILAALILGVWLNTTIRRISIGVDTNVYHLPLSLLMNNSIWYPGISRISSHMAFPNGTSVLASPFTSLGIPGLEFIPGFFIWVIYAIGIFTYLVKNRINQYLSFIVTAMFLLTPRFFWESYNMGTDMPAACFLTLGLFALLDKKYEDTLLFFALSSIFKTIGQVSFSLFLPAYVLLLCFGSKRREISRTKIIIAILLFAGSCLRLYIGTGNPIYPALGLSFAEWGIHSGIQKGLVNSLRYCIREASSATDSLRNLFIFLRDFTIFPKRLRCSYWFSPFLVTCIPFAVYFFIKERKWKSIDLNKGVIIILVSILSAIWLFSIPDFRFIAGPLVFVNLFLFCFIIKRNMLRIFRLVIYLSLFFTLGCFIFNVKTHLKRFIFPVYNMPAKEAIAYYSCYSDDIVSTVAMEDGFTYTVSKSTYCGRSKPPCLNAYTVGSKDEFIKKYQKHNTKFIKRR